MIEPFEKLNNVKVNVVTVYSADALAQLRAQKAAPQFDILHFSGGQEAVAAREGLLEKVTPADLADERQEPLSLRVAGLARGEGPVMHVAAMGLIYHADKVKPAPTSWKDLLDPKFKGHIVLTDFSNTYGLLSALMLNQALGGSLDNVEPGFNALQRPDQGCRRSSRARPTSSSTSSRTTLGLRLMRRTTPSRCARPACRPASRCRRRAIAGSLITANAVSGRPNRELAMKFIDFSLRTEAQEMWARDLRYSPVRRDVKLDPETAADVVYGEDAVRKLVVFDPIKIGEKRQAWVDQWNRVLGK